jgi:multidrug efflux pump subunit AcrB
VSGFSGFFVRNWQFTLIMFSMLAVVGINAVLTIPRAEDPSFPIPFVSVVVVLPGADPKEMENLVAEPIERAIDQQLDDIKEIRTTIRDGVAVILFEFLWETDPEKKFDEVTREINALRASLPANIVTLDINKFRTSYTNIVQIAYAGDGVALRAKEDAAESLKDILERIPGVREVEVWGAPRTEIRVSIDMGKLAELGVPVAAVSNALRNEAGDAPPGAVHAGARRFNVKATGNFKTLDDVGATVVLAANGRTLRVRDVAEVAWAYDEPRHLTRFKGQRAIFLTTNIKDNTNVFTLRDQIFAAIDAHEKDLPEGIVIHRGFDQSKNVAKRLNSLGRDFGIALALVAFTLLPLGLRAAAVVMISIPLSLAIGVVLLQAFGFSINQLSIAGFVLALGLLVDDSIVVTENIARHLREGMSRAEAAIAGTQQIGVAVVGCTAALMLAFLPLLFLAEGAGRFTRSLPVAVLFTVGASLIVALTIIPFLASRFLSERENPEGNIFLRVVMGGIHGIYRPILHVALQRPLTVVIASMVAFAASLLLIPRLGFSLFPASETPQFVIDIETPDGTALAETDKRVREVEAILARSEKVQWYMANTGRGNPRIFYNIIPEENRTNYGQIFVQIDKWEPRESPQYLDGLRAQFAKIAGAQINLRVFENGPPIEAPIAVRISGPDLATLKDLAARVATIMEATPGIRNVINPVRLDRTDLNLGLDTEKAAVLGVPAGAMDQAVRTALSGDRVARYRDSDGDEFDVVVRLPMDLRNDLAALGRIYVPTSSGPGIPLSQLSDPKFETSPSRIDRIARERVVTLTAFTKSGFLTSQVSTQLYGRLGKEIVPPPAYKIQAGGQAQAQSTAFAQLGTAIIIAVFGILAVLILEFRSFKATGVVAGIIPLGVMGGLVALWLAGYSLAFTAVIGFVALIGIEIKNSILLVDFTSQLRKQGVPLRDAIEQAGEIRFLPVLLTSVTAIGGLLPLAFESSGLYSPLAWVIIGGLISSTLLSRFVTPAMYLLLAPRDDELH